MKFFDWVVIGFFLVLGVIPDPLDVLDFGLPVIEGGAAIAYYVWRSRK